ncbi:MAG: type II toxin-antitoxin system HicA family toxin [Candidatus Gottesmanbacteria bacterium]|nr:type II toxin-antitoxin system HicA family toxin [Candidatus Gottesmanbacteria bacterium]
MTQLPTLTARKLIKILKRVGFINIRQEGSHFFFKHADGRTTVVPFHSGRDIGRGLLRSILTDINLMPKDLQKLL